MGGVRRDGSDREVSDVTQLFMKSVVSISLLVINQNGWCSFPISLIPPTRSPKYRP